MRCVSIMCAASVLALVLSAPGLCAPGATPSPKPLKTQTAVVVRVVNESHYCAWVTIYAARVYTPWTIMHGPSADPRFVREDRQFFDFNFLLPDVPVPTPGQVKVRAEVFKGPGCTGPKIADVSAEDKNIPTKAAGMVADLQSELSGDPATGGRFSITLRAR